MNIAYKVWLENNGKAFGEGPYRILKQIEKSGSLHQAASDLNISYRKAWAVINKAEKRLGFSFLEKRIGGTSGGGSVITPQGKSFLERYEKFREEVKAALEAAYKRHFE
ncbi:MAG: LysR family transcriptional regulator [Syntrophorhabdaceae bacterium]|nr:LysR family transcriptional regulator [Syntrophorhabdaceae bacterium]